LNIYEFKKQMIMDNRKEIVEKMINALTDRGGFDDWFRNIGEDIQAEIIEELVNILNNYKMSDLFDFTKDNTPEGTREQNVKADKQLRVNLDAELQKMKALPKSRETSISITKLQEAIMWLGMDLKRLNEANPYPDSYKPENTKIAPTADGMKM
jgi:hypothetical protein